MASFSECWGKLKAKGFKHANGKEVLTDNDKQSILDRTEMYKKEDGLSHDNAIRKSLQEHHDEAHAQVQSIREQLGIKPVEPTPAPTPKEEASAAVPPTEGTGGANVAAMEQRPIETPEVGQGIGQEQTRAAGHEWLDKDGDINKVISDFNRTGKINEWDVGKGSAYLERLQSVTDKTSDALRDNPNDSALQEQYNHAVASEQKFSDAFKPMATTASNTLKGFQGKTTLTDEMADSFSGLDRKFREFQGREMTPEEAVKADRLAKKNAKVKSDYSEASQNLYKNADETYKAVKGPSHVPTIQELAKALTGALEEVC